MIEKIELKLGTKEEPEFLDLDISNPTIIVGPNNSGKSLLLREIEQYLSHTRSPSMHIVNNMELPVFTEEEVLEDLEPLRLPNEEKSTNPDLINVFKPSVLGKEYESRQIHWPSIKAYFQRRDERTIRRFIEDFYSLFTLRLDGKNRFILTEPTQTADLTGPPKNHLMELFQADEKRERIRGIIYDALGKYFVIDPTSMNEFKIKFSSRAPANKNEEQSLDIKARNFHKNAEDIADMSDGVKAFTGIIASIFSSKYKTILIDEPEAFLHPPLARKLGLRVTEIARESDANILMATHSADFVMGCIESGSPINIVRLTYNQGKAKANILEHTELLSLMSDPMLRSTGIISSLFHNKVIVTEGDSDRAFYQEINLRLQEHNSLGIKNCLFINAQNKQTIRKAMKPLKELGVSVASIVDIDIIKDGGKNWKKLLEAAHVPKGLHESLNNTRQTVKRYFESTNKDMKKDGGISLLKGQEKETCINLFSQLADYGIFVVPFGEVESWLSYLEINSNKTTWLIKVFEAMKDDPESPDPDYLMPSPDEDVWHFMSMISEWFDGGRIKYDFLFEYR